MLDYGTKVANGGATAAGRLAHGEDNDRFGELKNAVVTAGIPLDQLSSNDLTMLAQAQARYASGGVNLEDIGSANAYVLQSSSAFILPKNYFEGMQVSFYPANANTGQSSINVNSNGPVDIRRNDGSHLQSGDIVSGRPVTARYDPSVGYFKILPWTLANFAAGEGGGSPSPGLVTEGLPFSLIASAIFTPTGTPSFVHSAGFSGLIDVALGHYRLVFTTAEPDTNYIVFTNSEEYSAVHSVNTSGVYEVRAVDKTTAQFDVVTDYHDAGNDYVHEPDQVSLMVFRS